MLSERRRAKLTEAAIWGVTATVPPNRVLYGISHASRCGSTTPTGMGIEGAFRFVRSHPLDSRLALAIRTD